MGSEIIGDIIGIIACNWLLRVKFGNWLEVVRKAENLS